MRTTSTIVDVAAGPVEVHTTGDGPPVLLLHGAFADESFWDEVVQGLVARGHRCVVPTMPLGSHRRPLHPGADLTLPALADLVAELVEQLDLGPVVVVANDSATAITQLLLVHHPEVVRAAVLTNGDVYEDFLPTLFRPVELVAHLPGGVRALAWAMQWNLVCRSPLAFGRLTLRGLTKAQRRRWTVGMRTDADIRRDATALLRGIDRHFTLDAAARFAEVHQPVLVLWGTTRSAFKTSLAERLVADLPDARLELVDDSSAFLPLDAPEVLVDAVDRFVVEVASTSARR